LPLPPDSEVYQGVTRAAYDARKSNPYKQRAGAQGYVAMRRPAPATGAFSAAGLKRFVKWLLEVVHLPPATLRALLRKPAPVHGGPKTRRLPWPVRRHFDGREQRAANRVLKREARIGGAVIYQGVEEEAYCRAFADYMGGGYADAVNSGTNAIYIALRALDLPPGSEVIVPPTSDAGGVMPVVMNMLVPVAADSMPGSINSSAEHIRKMITPRTKAILVTHMAGHPVDIDPVLDLAAEHGIPVVEDCAQSHGALYKGRMVGTFGVISAYSTMFGKHHCTGAQGGVVFTRDATLYAKARQIADRGKLSDPSGRLLNVVATLNFNQGEVECAIGQVQLAKLPGAVRHRRAFASKVAEGLKAVPGVSLAGDPAYSESSFYYLMIHLDRSRINCDSQTFAKALLLEGLDGVHAGYSVYPTDQVWHQQGIVFGKSGLPWSLHQQKPGRYELPNAHAANQSMLRVEIHESLGDQEARDLISAIAKVARFHAV
jgi:dTDP-4-amino-4,6-dideoxygalactose transaminase